MKNEDIHKAFGKADIRDFLAKTYWRGHIYGCSQRIKEEIKILLEKLELAKQAEAAVELAGLQGWEFWFWDSDVELESVTYMPFVGMEEEYDTLVATLKSEPAPKRGDDKR